MCVPFEVQHAHLNHALIPPQISHFRLYLSTPLGLCSLECSWCALAGIMLFGQGACHASKVAKSTIEQAHNQGNTGTFIDIEGGPEVPPLFQLKFEGDLESIFSD